MTKFATNIYVDGTAARKLHTRTSRRASIVSFPEQHTHKGNRARQSQTAAHPVSETLVSIARRSEMACSLLSETSAGCAYNLFEHRQVLFFSLALVAMLAFAVVFGA